MGPESRELGAGESLYIVFTSGLFPGTASQHLYCRINRQRIIKKNQIKKTRTRPIFWTLRRSALGSVVRVTKKTKFSPT